MPSLMKGQSHQVRRGRRPAKLWVSSVVLWVATLATPCRGRLSFVKTVHPRHHGTPVCFFCPVCKAKEPRSLVRGRHRPARQTPEFYYTRLADVAKERGGQLLSDSYMGSRAKHAFACRDGHQWEATAYNILAGCWCPHCSPLLERKRRTMTLKDMEKTAAFFGGQCLSTEYRGSQGKLRWKCKNGHIFEKTPNNIRRRTTGAKGGKGVFCSICYREERRQVQSQMQPRLWKDAPPMPPLPLPRKLASP